eukprot:6357840-Prymnesium_polylepis.2
MHAQRPQEDAAREDEPKRSRGRAGAQPAAQQLKEIPQPCGERDYEQEGTERDAQVERRVQRAESANERECESEYIEQALDARLAVVAQPPAVRGERRTQHEPQQPQLCACAAGAGVRLPDFVERCHLWTKAWQLSGAWRLVRGDRRLQHVPVEQHAVEEVHQPGKDKEDDAQRTHGERFPVHVPLLWSRSDVERPRRHEQQCAAQGDAQQLHRRHTPHAKHATVQCAAAAAAPARRNGAVRATKTMKEGGESKLQ